MSGSKAARCPGAPSRRPSWSLQDGLALVLGAVFLVAGILEAVDPSGLFAALRGYRLPVSTAVEAGVALAVPGLEVLVGSVAVVGGALRLAGWRRAGFAALTVLTAGFLLAMGYAVTHGGGGAGCGCFGRLAGKGPIDAWDFVRDGALLVAGVLGWAREARGEAGGSSRLGLLALPLGAAAVTVALTAGAWAGSSPREEGPSPPSFARVVVPFHLSSLAGRPAVVEVFASWCMFCAYEARWELPALETYAAQHHLALVSVDISPFGGIGTPGPKGNPFAGQDATSTPPILSAATARSLLRAYAARFHLHGTLGYEPNPPWATAMGVRSFPTFLLLDGRGRLVAGMSGVQSAASLIRVIETSGLVR